MTATITAWSITQVKKWKVERVVENGEDAIRLNGGSFSEVISYRAAVSGTFTAPSGFMLEKKEIAGKPLSKAACCFLSPAIRSLVLAVRADEAEKGAAALLVLQKRGATVTECGGSQWVFTLGGEAYYLFGRATGPCGVALKHKRVGGFNYGTFEEFLAFLDRSSAREDSICDVCLSDTKCPVHHSS